jgi:hypothetical protein
MAISVLSDKKRGLAVTMRLIVGGKILECEVSEVRYIFK